MRETLTRTLADKVHGCGNIQTLGKCATTWPERSRQSKARAYIVQLSQALNLASLRHTLVEEQKGAGVIYSHTILCSQHASLSSCVHCISVFALEKVTISGYKKTLLFWCVGRASLLLIYYIISLPNKPAAAVVTILVGPDSPQNVPGVHASLMG